jgi:hypothetical protein
MRLIQSAATRGEDTTAALFNNRQTPAEDIFVAKPEGLFADS